MLERMFRSRSAPDWFPSYFLKGREAGRSGGRQAQWRRFLARLVQFHRRYLAAHWWRRFSRAVRELDEHFRVFERGDRVLKAPVTIGHVYLQHTFWCGSRCVSVVKLRLHAGKLRQKSWRAASPWGLPRFCL